MRALKVLELEPYLNGASQIMFQESPWTGLLFIAGIFWASPVMGAATVLAIFSGTLAARLLKYDEAEISRGMYGFSAALVGADLSLYYRPVPLVWAAIVAGAIVAAILQHAFLTRKIPGYTFPFVLVTWLIICIFKYGAPAAAVHQIVGGNFARNIFAIPVNGLGQVMFVGNTFSSTIFLIAVFICSPLAALYALFGSLLGANLAAWMRVPPEAISHGLFSFNAVLCAIAFAGTKVRDVLWVIACVVLAVLIQIAIQKLNLVPLTFPFVLAAWVTLILRKALG